MKNIKKVSKKIVNTILSISGFIPEHMSLLRYFFMFGSILAVLFFQTMFKSVNYAIIYFIFSTVIYLGFVFFVLPEKGYRLKLIELFGEKKAYLVYEAFLAFAFFHNAASLSFISQSSAGSSFFEIIPVQITMLFAAFLFIIGTGVKIWSAYVVGIPIYYWKDMFLGKRISDFVVAGPYKYFSNPMYGIGQIQIYAIAIYYNSIYGLLFGVINQGLVFLFYFLVEKQFIYRTYLQKETQKSQTVGLII